MCKRWWWVFSGMAVVGVALWWESFRTQSNLDGGGAVSNQQTPVDGPGSRNSEKPNQETVRESKRHSSGEVERHQAEERRFFELKKSIREQENKVEARRNGLAAIIRDQLFIYAAELDDPDNAVKVLHPQYVEARQGLEKLQIGGLIERHPTAVAQIEKIEAIGFKLDQAVANLKGTSKAQLDQRAMQLEAAKELLPGQAVSHSENQDVLEARRNFETDERILQQMKLVLASEREKSQPDGR